MNSNRNKRICIALATALALSAASGCSVREYAARSIGDAMASGGEVYASDNDIELVGVATPFGLKTMESLLAVVPDHRGLLLAATRGFTQYAYVYVQLPAEDLEARDVARSWPSPHTSDRGPHRRRAQREEGRLRSASVPGSEAEPRGGPSPAQEAFRTVDR